MIEDIIISNWNEPQSQIIVTFGMTYWTHCGTGALPVNETWLAKFVRAMRQGNGVHQYIHAYFALIIITKIKSRPLHRYNRDCVYSRSKFFPQRFVFIFNFCRIALFIFSFFLAKIGILFFNSNLCIQNQNRKRTNLGFPYKSFMPETNVALEHIKVDITLLLLVWKFFSI